MQARPSHPVPSYLMATQASSLSPRRTTGDDGGSLVSAGVAAAAAAPDRLCEYKSIDNGCVNIHHLSVGRFVHVYLLRGLHITRLATDGQMSNGRGRLKTALRLAHTW